MSCYTEELLDETVNQIQQDMLHNQRGALRELLEFIPAPALEAYLEPAVLKNLKRVWKLESA